MTARSQRNASGRRCVYAAVSLGGALFAWNGCVTPTTPAAVVTQPARRAILAIQNQTPYQWQVQARAVHGGEARRVSIEARSTVELALDGGEYAIEQRIMTPGVAMEGARTFAITIEPGERYAWELATLLTAAEGSNLPQP